MRGRIYNGFNHGGSNLVSVNAVVLGVSPDETDENEKKRSIFDLPNQPVGVAFDIENDAVSRQEVCGAKHGSDLSQTRPCGSFNHGEPETKRLFRIRVPLPEVYECVPAEDAQLLEGNMLPRWEHAPGMARS